MMIRTYRPGRDSCPRSGGPAKPTPWTLSRTDPDPARWMTFYLGAPSPRWGEHAPAPLFISANRLGRYRRHGDDFPRMSCVWALDSGGFTELRDHGDWRMHPMDYGAMVTRFLDDGGAPPQWCAPQDWMCEPAIIHGGTVGGQRYAGTGRSVREHQELTIENLLYLREEFYFVPWVPVLQGWRLDDYLAHAEMYAAAGVDLAAESLVGLGSVCRRGSEAEIEAIVSTFHARGYRLHGFGLKVSGLRRIGHMLASADSMAWSMKARREQIRLDSCRHPGPCSSCLAYALHWREDVLDALRTPKQLSIDLAFSLTRTCQDRKMDLGRQSKGRAGDMQRTITRQWRGNGVHVSTQHPQLGTMRRGHISAASYGRPAPDPQARAVWRVTDHEGIGLDDVTGDYVDAEAALLAATAWADEPVDPAELDD